MLSCNHGASTLGKTIARPIISRIAMNTLERAAAFATENVRSATSKTADAIKASPSARPNVNRTWSPQHGIVFGPRNTAVGYRGLNTSAADGAQSNDSLQSGAEEAYVLGSPIKMETLAKAEPAKLKRRKVKTTCENAVVGAASTETVETSENTAIIEPEIEPEDPEQNDLPKTPTSYKMTEVLFRAAKTAEPGSLGSFWSHTLYRGPTDSNGKAPRPVIHYCRSKLTTERVIKSYFMDQKVIGFDIEWKPEVVFKNKGPRQNVSLIQIAIEDRIALFHLALYPKVDPNAKDAATPEAIQELVSPLLKQILEDPSVKKVGVAVKGDCTRIRKHLEIHPQGIFELSHLNKLVKFSKTKDFAKINKKPVSLAKQVQEHLHLPMSKVVEVRSSDWSRPLGLAQISYAAADSYAGFQLFHTMEMKRKALNPTPPCPWDAELDKPIRFAEGVEIAVDGEAEEALEEGEGELLTTTKSAKLQKEVVVDKESIKVEDSEADPAADYVPPSSTV